MERAHRRLSEATDRLLYGSGDRDDFYANVQESLSAFAEAFTLVTGSNCRATIKEVYYEDWLPPPARPGASANSGELILAATLMRSEVDSNYSVASEESIRVDENSDFEEVLRTGAVFFSNDLPSLWESGKYQNSHWGPELRSTRVFPYESAIVWPIRVDPRRPTSGASPTVIAFLCVDTQRKRAFVRRADIALGASYAHALYPGLYYAREPSSRSASV